MDEIKSEEMQVLGKVAYGIYTGVLKESKNTKIAKEMVLLYFKSLNNNDSEATNIFLGKLGDL